MKNKKKNTTDSLTLVNGKIKQRKWPWLFVLLAVLLLANTYIQIAIEFNNPETRANVCKFCTDYTSFVFHYSTWVDNTLLVAGALVLIAILCRILFVRKRTLTVTPTELVYKKGRKTIQIPLASIESVDARRSKLFVSVPFKKFKFAKLKNAKEVSDAIVSQKGFIATTFTLENDSIPSLTNMAAPLLANPTLAGKLAYFEKLFETGLISKAEYNKYVDLSRKADAPAKKKK